MCTVKNNLETIVFPHVVAAHDLLARCVKSESFGVIHGGNGCGKSITLKYLSRHAESCGITGEALYYRCCYVDGQTRGIRDFLTHLGAGGAMLANGSSISVQMASKLAGRELRQRNIRAILLDEADLWTISALTGFVTMLDVLKEQGRPISVVFAGALNPEMWIGAIPSARSRILHMQVIPMLDVENTAGVLAEWHPGFAEMTKRFDDGDRLALQVFQAVHKGTGGNLRRLSFFRNIFPSDTSITLKGVKSVLSQMVNSAVT